MRTSQVSQQREQLCQTLLDKDVGAADLLTRLCTLRVMDVSPWRNPTTEDGQYRTRAVISLF